MQGLPGESSAVFVCTRNKTLRSLRVFLSDLSGKN